MILCREYDSVDGLVEEEYMPVLYVQCLREPCLCACVCVILFSVHLHASDLCRILELTDTVKHLRNQNSEKDASLNTMQISLDRMVGPWESWLGGGRLTGG